MLDQTTCGCGRVGRGKTRGELSADYLDDASGLCAEQQQHRLVFARAEAGRTIRIVMPARSLRVALPQQEKMRYEGALSWQAAANEYH